MSNYDATTTISNDPGLEGLHLAKDVDRHHTGKLKKITESLEELNHLMRKFSSLKRELEAKNDGKKRHYDVTELHEKLLDFQEFFNKDALESEKLNFDNEDAYKILKSKTSQELEAIGRKIEDALSSIKDQASDQTNQVYLQGHLYTIVMNIFQELIRIDSRGKERLAQASRTH